MADAWNPNAPRTVGIEWQPTLARTIGVNATDTAVLSMLQTTSQAISGVQVYIETLPVRGGIYGIDVYDSETIDYGDSAQLSAVPNEDVSGTGSGSGQWREDDGTTTTIYSEIDETIAAFNYTDYIYNGTGSAKVRYTSRLNTASLTLTGKRIFGLVLYVVGSRISGSGSLVGGLNISGVDYQQFSTADGAGIGEFLTYNPATKKPWTIADIQAFDSTDEWYIEPSAAGSVFWVYAAEMLIIVVDETRIAYGGFDDSASALTAGAWNTASLLTPTGGTWTKDASDRHSFVVGRLNSTGAMTFPTLAAATEAPNARTLSFVEGLPAQLPIFGLILRTTGAAESVDSQPYVHLIEGLAFTGQNVEQEFSTATNTDAYARILAIVKPNDATADLTITIRKRSDSSQVGGTLTLTAAEVDALDDAGDGWKLIDGRLSSVASLANATQYYLRFESTCAGTGTDYWSVVALDTGNAGNGATFGGTTDRALVNTSEADRYDLACAVSTVPAAIAGLAAVVTDQAIP